VVQNPEEKAENLCRVVCSEEKQEKTKEERVQVQAEAGEVVRKVQVQAVQVQCRCSSAECAGVRK